MPNPFFKEYSDLLSEKFPGAKVQKISVNAGFSCPNRDGSIATGGCIYCDNSTFVPAYALRLSSVKEQIEAGKHFFRRKYREMKFIAYFQAYTSTNERIPLLLDLYNQALECEEVVGLIIGTRPDCIPDCLLAELARINEKRPVMIELGAETSNNLTLKLINRHHTWQQTEDAAVRIANHGISCGLHLIAGLPGESPDDTLQSVKEACRLPIDSIKMHQLQIIKGTELHRRWQEGAIEVNPYSLDDYLSLCEKIVEIVPRHIAIDRFVSQSPPEKVAAPLWGIKNYQFTNLLLNRLAAKNKRLF